jgi:hypothetical protein
MIGPRCRCHDPASNARGGPSGVQTSGMSRRWLLVGAVLTLIVAGVLAWRMWPHDPGPVAPQVTVRELRQADRVQEGSLTLLGGGSKTQAHRLWAYYRDRPPIQGVKPRLLGISRVQLRDSPEQPDGIYWLVFLDHVYQYAFGGCCDGVGREVVFVPDGSTSVSGNTTTF